MGHLAPFDGPFCLITFNCYERDHLSIYPLYVMLFVVFCLLDDSRWYEITVVQQLDSHGLLQQCSQQ